MASIRALSCWGVLSAALAQCSSPIVAGQLPINIDGKATNWSVAVTGGSTKGVSTNANSMTMMHGARGYLVSGCPSTYSADMYDTKLPLLGKMFNYTIDLSTSGCACNAAVYATLMPAYSSANQPDPTNSRDYYCDANAVSGIYCPEMDIMEANTAALQVTPHNCAAPQGHYYPQCDKGGCAQNTHKISPNGYGPGASFGIDTTKPFSVSTRFIATGGQLTGVSTTLSQPGGKPMVLSHADSTCGSGYLEKLSDALTQGLIIVFSVWGSTGQTMSWLDIPPCSASTSCNAAQSSMIVSAMSLTTM